MSTISIAEYEQIIESARSAFRPFSPVSTPDLFKGRTEFMADLASELKNPGRHAVLFGDRGVGKTSVANLLDFFLNHHEDETFNYKCSSKSKFQDMFCDILTQAGITHIASDFTSATKKGVSIDTRTVGASRETSNMHNYSPIRDLELTPQIVCGAFSQRNSLIVIDEFDRCRDADTNGAIADVMKDLSDRGSYTKLVLVGVADSVHDLIGEHPSIVRNIKQAHLQRMTTKEISEIISDGFGNVGIKSNSKIRERVAAIADGFPHFAHLLGLNICNAYAIRLLEDDNERLQVAEADLWKAIRKSIQGTEASLKKSFDDATRTTRKKSDQFLRVLQGIAMSDSKEVQVGEIVQNINFVFNTKLKKESISYQLGQLVRGERGTILVRSSVGYYKFRDPMMRAFVRLNLCLDNYEKHDGQLELPFMELERKRDQISRRN